MDEQKISKVDIKYWWIYKEIIKEPNLPVENILLNLSELLKDSIERYESYCNDSENCYKFAGNNVGCDGCKIRNKNDYYEKQLNILWDFIKENNIDDIIRFEDPI